MRASGAHRLTAGMFAPFLAALLPGCATLGRLVDRPPSPPRTSNYHKVDKLDISSAPQAERNAATALESARRYYRHRLQVLAGYYSSIGDATKLTWARRELKNLDNVQTFEWVGVEQGEPLKGEDVAGADERLLVEMTVTARRNYLDALASLRKYYESTGASFRMKLARNMEDRFDPVRTYMYFLSAEIPGPDLRPKAVIPEADKLFKQALDLYRSGKILPAVTNYAKERRALVLFRKLVQNYPTSNTIAEAAYYIGEIYKEYFREYVRAVHWYERAWQWDPNIMLPARFQCATVYDFHLQMKSKAVACYRAAIAHEQFRRNNVRYANQRIEELTGKPPLVEEAPKPSAAPSS